MGTQGWRVGDAPGCIPDTVNGFDYLHQVYTLARHDYTGRGTVPVLFDKHSRTIINNESAEIIEMLNSAFDAFGDAGLDFFPAELRAEMAALNTKNNECISGGGGRAGGAAARGAGGGAGGAGGAARGGGGGRRARRRGRRGARGAAAGGRGGT